MVARSFAGLALALVACSAVAQEVRLPPEQSAIPGEWVIISPEIVSGGKAKFRIDPGLQEVRLDLLFPPDVITQARGKVLRATTPGLYKVECWNALKDVPSDIATCWVTIAGTVPPGPDPPKPEPVPVPPGPDPPKPEPVPVPPVPAGPRQVLILRESADDTPALSRLLISLAGGKGHDYLKSKGHAFFNLDVDAKDASGAPDANVVKWKAAIDLMLPCVAILDAKGNVLHKETLPATATADDVLTALRRFE